MSNFQEMAAEVKEEFADYKERNGLEFSATAYQEKFDRREPERLLEERKEIFKKLAAAVHTGREERRTPEEIRDEFRGHEVPEPYIRRAERAVDEKEREEERRQRLTEAERQEIQQQIAFRLSQEQARRDEFAFLFAEQEKLMKEDQLKSMLEYGRHKGLTDVELISIAVESGVPHDQAEYLVENSLQDDVDRQFYKDERYYQEEYDEQEQEMTHGSTTRH